MIKEVNENAVVLTTSHLAPKNEGGGTNLSADNTDLNTTLNKGDSVKLSTQTMDQGTSYTFTLNEIIL